ncbi:unnamed protein product [Strongylus vulgaris]|uniref:Uncharacterized protein n=1 Tax=Strongylus vulgaris TaxID=40348 RepID=A0A3P7J441_STRVU|nr:unnamed protein product [Strongylus vulgaris]
MKYREKTLQELKKKEAHGLFIPGYLALILSLSTVIALAVTLKLCSNYRKKNAGSSMGILDIGLTPRGSPATRTGSKEIQIEESSKKAKDTSEEANKLRSEPYAEFNVRPMTLHFVLLAVSRLANHAIPFTGTGSKEIQFDESSKKPKDTSEEANKLRSEPYAEFNKNMSRETLEELAPIIAKGRSTDEVLENPVNAPEFLFYLHRLTRLAIEYFDDPAAFSVTTGEG